MANLYPILAITNFLMVIVKYVFNALSGSGPDGTIFLNSTGDLSDKYYTEITPAGWTFSIWGFIYTWEAAWVIFSLVNICRKGTKSQPAYLDPQYLPISLFLISIVVNGLNVAWLISFDRQEIEIAAAVLIAYTVLQYSMMVVTYRSLDKSSPKLVEEKRTLDIWLTRALVLNGIGMQATWVSIATLLNISMVMIYSGDEVVSVEDAGTVALSLLSAIILVFVISDLFFLDRYSRYTITPYIVLVVALGGSISKNWDSKKRNSIFSAVLIAICSVFLLLKLVITLYKHFTKPRYHLSYDSTLEREPESQLKEKISY